MSRFLWFSVYNVCLCNLCNNNNDNVEELSQQVSLDAAPSRCMPSPLQYWVWPLTSDL